MIEGRKKPEASPAPRLEESLPALSEAPYAVSKVYETPKTASSSSSSKPRRPEAQSAGCITVRSEENSLPRINHEIPKTESPEDIFVPPTTWLGKLRDRMEQQEPSTSLLPMHIVSWKFQACCSGCCGAMLAFMGVILVMGASSTIEVVIPYKYPDTFKDFDITEDMEGDINMWYDVGNKVWINQKRYVENTDPDLIELWPIGKKACKDTESKAEAVWRRIDIEQSSREKFPQATVAADKWSTLVQAQTAFKPCGLQSISMFTDEYSLVKRNDGNDEVMALDESDLYLKPDDDIYKGKIDEAVDANGETYLTLNGQRSWIQAGKFYEHFKVWMRSPASSHARHLWAVKRGGLKKGSYRLNFLQNSAIWTSFNKGWELDEKRVVLSTQSVFGTKGAARLLSIVCFICAFIEVLVMASFIILGCAPQEQQRSTVDL